MEGVSEAFIVAHKIALEEAAAALHLGLDKLVQLVKSFVALSDQYLGSHVAHPNRATRIPFHLLTHREGLVCVARSCLSFLQHHTFHDLSQCDAQGFSSLISLVYSDLRTNNIWKPPHVAVDATSSPEFFARVSEVLSRHGATVMKVGDPTLAVPDVIVRQHASGLSRGGGGGGVVVSAQYVEDLEKFNQWPNVMDYTVDHDDVNGDKKRVRGDGNDVMMTESSPVRGDMGLKRVKTQDVVIKSPTATSRYGTLKSDEAVVAVAPTTFPKGPVELILPSSATWFKMENVHQFEQNALQEFFDGHDPAKTPQSYKNYRDFMVNAYWQNPDKYLSFTACRRSLMGDSCAIMRVHQFLESHGIINYQVTSAVVPTAIPENVPLRIQSRPTKTETPMKLPLATHDALFDNGSGPTRLCVSCGEQCGSVRYDNVADAGKRAAPGDVTVCQDCWSTSRLPSGWKQQQFEARDNTSNDVLYAGVWTKEQTLKLLGAVEKYGENWVQVAAAVGEGKTDRQCLLHFLRLPIEDPFLSAATTSIGKSGRDADLPFAHTSTNPVMTLLAFISSVLPPDVAAGAATAAQEYIRGKGSEQNALEDPKAIAAVALAAAGERANVLAQKEAVRVEELLVKTVQLQLKGLQERLAKLAEAEARFLEQKMALQRQGLSLQSPQQPK